MKNEFRKVHVTKNGYQIRITGAITASLIELLPMISIAHQSKAYAYGGIHSFVEFGFLVFHLKISWKKIEYHKPYCDHQEEN